MLNTYTSTIQHNIISLLNLPPCYSLVACPPYPHVSSLSPLFPEIFYWQIFTSTYLSGFSQQQFEMAHLPTHAGGHGTPHQILLQFQYNNCFETRRMQTTTKLATQESIPMLLAMNHAANDLVAPCRSGAQD